LSARNNQNEGRYRHRPDAQIRPTRWRRSKGVEAKVANLNSSGVLPAGLTRSCRTTTATNLVQTTLRTVLENLTVGMAAGFPGADFFSSANLRAGDHRGGEYPARQLCGAFHVDAFHQHAGPISFRSVRSTSESSIDTTVIVMEKYRASSDRV